RDDGALDLLNAGGRLVGMALFELGKNVGEVLVGLAGFFGWRLGHWCRNRLTRRFGRVVGCFALRRCALLASGFGSFGGRPGLGNAFVAHDVYCSIVPRETRASSRCTCVLSWSNAAGCS